MAERVAALNKKFGGGPAEAKKPAAVQKAEISGDAKADVGVQMTMAERLAHLNKLTAKGPASAENTATASSSAPANSVPEGEMTMA